MLSILLKQIGISEQQMQDVVRFVTLLNSRLAMLEEKQDEINEKLDALLIHFNTEVYTNDRNDSNDRGDEPCGNGTAGDNGC